MELTNEQKSVLRFILKDPDMRDALAAAFQCECARLEHMALANVNSRKQVESERCADFAGAYKSVMSRLEWMSGAEEPRGSEE